eukprot:bmy_07568T0
MEKGRPCSATGLVVGHLPTDSSPAQAWDVPLPHPAVSSGQWQQTNRTADGLYPTQAPKGRLSGLPATSGSKPFQLWAQGLFCTERNLAKRLKNNSFYPFTQQQPNAYGVGVGLWLMISSLPRRRLVLNHVRGVYHFSIQGRTVCQGPMHLVYVRMALSSDGSRFQLPRGLASLLRL